MKKSKKISVLISLVLILILALSAVSAADDAIMADDSDLASVDEVQTVDNTQTTDEIYTEPTDIVVTDTGDSGDLDDADSDVISDTGQKDDSDDGDEAVVSDASSPKNALKAEPLRAEGDGTFTELYNLIRNGGTVTLNKNYAYNPSTDSSLRNGMTIAADLTINGNGHTIDGGGVAKIFILNGYTTTILRTTYHGHTYTFKDLNFINAYSTALGGVITSQDYPNTITISNCNFTNNQGYRGAAVYASTLEDTFTRPVDTGSITITGCIFKENYASNNGGAIYSGINYDTSSFTIYNNVFVNNTSPGAAKAIFYANANYINVNYNWWGQNGWNNGFVAQSGTTYIIPQYSYKAAISQTGSNSVKVEMVLNGSTAPSGSTLPARNATFSIGSGAIESTGPLTADFVASTDTTITAKVDNGDVTLNVYKSPKWDINQLEVIGTSVDLPNQPTIIVNSDVDGIYNITIGSYTNTVNVQNGQGILSLEGFGEGEYVVVASRTNDPIYNDKYATGTFSVSKLSVIIDIEASAYTITYGQQVTIIPHVTSLDFDENALQYYVDGHIASSTLSDLSVGTHNVIAKFEGNATHKSAESNTIQITVDKASVSLSVDDSNVAYGQAGTVTLHTNVPGYYTVAVGNGEPIIVKVTGDTKTVTISDLLPTGTHTITVSYDGDENHYARTATASYVVGPDSIHVSVNPVNPTYPDAGQVLVSSNVDGTYIVTINDKPYEVSVEDGQGTVNVDKLDAGDYTISVSAQIEGYDPIEIENAGTYSVRQGEVAFSISQKDAEVIYGDVANVTALITDGATGTITYYVDGVAQAPVAVGSEYGVNNLSAGTHTIFAKYSGDDNYNAAESNAIEITVSQATPIIYVVPNNETYPNNAIVVVAVYSRKMVGLNATVRVTINGVTYALDTIDGGNYLVIEGLDAGEYPITAVTVANENYASATNATEKLAIYKANLTITAVPNATSVTLGDEISFTNTITAPEGAVTDGTVTYYVDGEAIDGDSISTLGVGSHNVVAKYSGDPNFNVTESAPVSFTVTKANPTLTISANATEIKYLDDIKLSYAITPDGATGSVVYYLNGTAVDGDVLSMLAPGNYNVTAKYEGNEYYNAVNSSNSLSITVGKCDVSIEVNSNNYTIEYGQAVLLTSAVTPFRATVYVTYIVDGVESDQYYFTDLSAGTHTIAARAHENVFYNGALSETKTITVNKATPTIGYVFAPTTYPNNASFMVTVANGESGLDGVTVEVTVDGVTYANQSIGGFTFFNIPGLNAGEYPINIVSLANENYASATDNTQTLVVNKANLTITAVPSATSVVMGDEISFTNTITAPEGAVTSGTVTYYVDNEPITGDSISDLSVGTHSVVAKYTGDPNFNDAESTAVPFTVTEAAIVVTGQSTSVVYPNKGNIVITTNVAGTYTIKVGDVTYEDVTLAAGENIFSVTDVLPVGNHAVKVSANIKDYQEITDVSIATYTVTKGDLTIAVNPNATNIKYGESVTLESTISAPEGAQTAGTVTYYVDGVAISGNTLPKLSVGTHTVVAKYTGDSNFNDAESASKTITVGKKTPIVDVFANPSYTYPNDVRFIVEVFDERQSNSLEGVTVEVTVNEVTYVGVTGVDGTVEFTIKGLNVGEYTIYATSLENENYTSAEYNEEEFEVVKATATVTSGDVTVYYPANGKVNITASVPGTYTVKVGNGEYTATVTTAGGTATVDIPTLDVGEYGISVTADLGNNYNLVDTGVINTYTVSPGTLIVTVENVTAAYPNTGVVTVKSDVDGDYDVIVNSRVYRAHVVDGEGSVTVQKLNPGIYNIRVQAVIDNYETFNDIVARYTVTKGTIDVTAQDASATYPETGSIVITTNVAGTYTIKVGESFSREVDLEAGENTVAIDSILNAGTYDVSVSATIDNYNPIEDKVIATYTVNQADVSINIEASENQITYGQTVTIIPTISPDSITAEDISYYLDGAAASDTLTDLSVGTHTVVAKYAGSTNYKAAESNAVTITVAKASPNIEITSDPVTYPDDAIVNIALTGANNLALPGATIKVTVNGVTYAVTTDNEGKARLTIKGLDADEYPITAVSIEDDSYESATYTGDAKVTVNKATATVSSGDVTVIYPANGKVNIISSVPGTYIVKVGNDEYTATVTAAGGSTTVDIPTMNVGEYGISVTADLGSNYNAVDTGVINTYTVSAGTIVVTGEGATVLYPNNATITVNTTVAGTYTIKIDGRSYDVTLAVGENEVYVPYVLNPGNYPVFISADIANYAKINIKEIASYKVSKGIIHVSAQDSSVTYPGKGTIVITADVIGDYDITIGSKTYRNVHLSMGENSFEVPDRFDAGTYEVSVSAAESSLYQALDAQNIASYSVGKANVDMTVVFDKPEGYVYGDDVTVIVTVTPQTTDEKLNEVIELNIMGKESQRKTLENGVARFTLDGYDAGLYTIWVNFFGTENYNDLYNISSFIIGKATPVVEVNDTTAEWGVPVTIPVKVTDENGNPIAGSVIVTVDWDVDGKTQVVELDENGWGEATFTITEALGRLRITANYTGSDNIESVEDIATLFIGESTQLTLEVTANEVTFGEDTILTLTATNARGIEIPLVNANVTIGDVTERYAVINGKINVGKLPVGETDITVKAGGGIYNWDEDTTTAVVKPAVPVLIVTPGTGQVTVETYGIDGPIGGTAKIIVDGDAEHPITVTIDETGHIVVPIDAAPGGHAVEVIFNNDNYVEARQTVAVNVPKLTPIVAVTGATVEYGNPATVKVKVTDEDGNPITGTVIVVASWLVDGETQVVELDTDGTGEATFVLAGLGQGNYADINATYVENDIYASAYNDTEKIYVTDSSELTLEVIANEVTVGENTILTITATDGSGAAVDLDKVNVTIDSVTKEYAVENGQVNIGQLPVGTTEILVSIDDEFYGHAQDTTEAKVNKAAADVTVTPGNGTVTVVAKDNETGQPISGTATVVIDGGEPKEVPIGEDGTIEYPIDAAPGPHTVEVRFNNDNYEPVSKTVTVIVPKLTPIVEVNDTNTEWGVPVSIPVKVTDADGNPLTGSVIVTVDWTVDGKTQVVELDENGWGEATFTITEALGSLTITANYTGNDNYESVKETATLFIGESTKLTLEVTANEVTFGEDTILTLNATNARGIEIPLVNANVTIGDVTERYAVINGKINVGKLPVGETEITVKAGGGIYNWDEDTTTAVVKPAVPVLIVTSGTGQVTVETYGINGPIGGTAKIIVDGDAEHPITVTIDETGHIVVPIDAAPGGHAVEVIFNNDNYVEARQTVAVNVPKLTPIVSVTGATVEYGNPATVKVKVTDEEGNPITGTVIVVASWLVDGETQVVELNASGEGQATFVLAGLGQGNYADINATFIENDNFASAYNDTEKIHVTDSSELTLEVTANEVTLGEDTILTVTATDGSGAEVDLDKVNVTIDGETKEYAVEDGQVNIGKLPVGTTEILVSVDDEFYGHAQDTTEAKVNKAAADVTVTPGNGTVTVVAKDKETGQPISGTATVVIDGGEPKEVPIGEDGTIEYPIDAAPGPHTVEVRFNNDDYEPVSKTVTVIVPKAETTLTIATEDVPSYGDDVTVTATITEGATGTITYYVDGLSVGTELAIGKDFVVSGLSAGEHNVTAKYAGDDLYGPAESNVLKFTVAKAELVITIDSAQTYYPNTGTVEVSANNDGVYTINVNGKPYTVTIANGKGTFEVTEVLAVAEYPITWDIAESENYTGATGSAVYKVLNTAPDFSITGSSEIDYGNTNTIVPTINEDATGTITYTVNGVEKGTLGLKENLVLEGLDADHYIVVAEYSGDVNYGSMSKTFEFDVLPIDVIVSVASDEVYYPNTGSVNLNVSAPGTYTVYVGNKSYEVKLTAPGVVNIPVELLEVGKYDINVTAPATTNYNAVDTGAIGTYVVSKAKSIINVEYDSATGKATVTLVGAEGNIPLNESISFEIDGTAIPGVETSAGVYVSDDLALSPGKHSIFVVFVGNDNYLGSYGQTAFEVDKFATAEVTVSADPIKEGEEAVILITVKDGDKGLTGVVTVNLDGTDYAVDVTDGEGTLKVKNLVATTSPVTTYDITAKFNGNDEYAESTGTGTIDVTDYNDVIIVISGGQDSAVATLVDTDGNNINGKVNVTVDGTGPQEFDVVDGKVIIPIDEKGDHEITVDYPGDGTHPSASKTDTVFVGKTLISTTLTLTVSDITYTEDEEAVVVLSAEDGSRLTGTVTLTIGDKVQEVTITDGIGVTTVTGLSAGKKTAIAEFAESGKYAYSIATAPFEVRQMNTRIVARNMTTTAINVTEDGRIGEYLVWTLVDEKGRPLAGKAMSIGFNAKVYNRTTDENGQARLQINLQNSGTYTFAISFLGDDNYNGSFEVVKIDVNKQKAQLTASGATYKASAATKTLSATFKTKAGNPIVGKTIKFTVNGKTYSAKTDSKGVAKVNVSLTKAGSYSVKITAPATNTYAETSKTVTLKLT